MRVCKQKEPDEGDDIRLLCRPGMRRMAAKRRVSPEWAPTLCERQMYGGANLDLLRKRVLRA
jgi:hypothetical protein